jgi:hypothetical protein
MPRTTAPKVVVQQLPKVDLPVDDLDEAEAEAVRLEPGCFPVNPLRTDTESS